MKIPQNLLDQETAMKKVIVQITNNEISLPTPVEGIDLPIFPSYMKIGQNVYAINYDEETKTITFVS